MPPGGPSTQDLPTLQAANTAPPHTFDHNHVDINGADGGLGQPFPLLQQVRDLPGWDPVVRLGPKSHQLPYSHTWGRDRVRRSGKEGALVY